MILPRSSGSISIIHERFASLGAALPALEVVAPGPEGTVIDSLVIINTGCTSTHAFSIVISYQ